MCEANMRGEGFKIRLEEDKHFEVGGEMRGGLGGEIGGEYGMLEREVREELEGGVGRGRLEMAMGCGRGDKMR